MLQQIIRNRLQHKTQNKGLNLFLNIKDTDACFCKTNRLFKFYLSEDSELVSFLLQQIIRKPTTA